MREPGHKTDSVNGNRFPGYDVLSKRSTPSWNEKTRDVVMRRLCVGGAPKFFTPHEFATVGAIAARIVPQPVTRPAIPVASLVDEKLNKGKRDGYRLAGMPQDDAAWQQGLKALDAEVVAAFGCSFRELQSSDQDALLVRMQSGDLTNAAWQTMASNVFFKMRLAHDIVEAYYSHPTAWSEVGWGGPASPRGYVRMDYNERDPWEAAEVKGGDIEAARWNNRHVR